MTPKPLAPERLRQRCDVSVFDFKTTAELEPLALPPGQERAIEALDFALDMASDAYNVYAVGPPGFGKHAVVRRIVEAHAAKEAPPPDRCYVNNFTDPQKPRALTLPAGLARRLRDDMERLVQDLHAAIPAAFESDDYRSRREAIEEEFKSRHEKALEAIQERARERGIALIRTPAGLGFAPMRNGEVINPEAFRVMHEDERKRIEADVEELQGELQTVIRELPALVRESRRRLRELNREVTRFAVEHLIEELRESYAGHETVVAYLDAVREDVIENAGVFLQGEDGQGPAVPIPGAPVALAPGTPHPLNRYKVNVIVDHGGETGAPVVYEDRPTYQHLIGDVEHVAQMGALTTDFTLIKPGALHRANGGYLIVDARRLVQQPFAYEALKQALRAGCIRIESLGQALSLVSTRSLEPEPVPLSVKVMLIGDRFLYYLLSTVDPEFGDLFKIAADFDDRLVRDDESAKVYARLIAGLVHEHGLRPLDAGAVARVIERGARLAGDAERLTLRIESLVDLLREADLWCAKARRRTIRAKDIDHAIAAQIRRANRIEERMREEITRGTIRVETSGAAIGQVNGLSVIQLGGYAFGRPSRITARVRMGKGEVIDIEREVALGGPLHSKGVLILSGFLGARFGAARPLALAASLVFEQSYSGVDGDSASSAELYALLSALAEVPIRQSLAVTGSVDQLGRVQAIGGVNEKIEGFFDLCAARGLTGEQGVLIPASNVRHLMLRDDVVAAAAKGKFHIHPVETIDQGIELLTGLPAGERGADGAFPPDTINHRVERRLDAFAEKLKLFAAKPENEAKS